jgi:hypothetical protein
MKRAMTPLMNGSRHDDSLSWRNRRQSPAACDVRRAVHSLYESELPGSWHDIFRLWKGKYISVRWSSVCCQFSAQLRIIPCMKITRQTQTTDCLAESARLKLRGVY